jgi:hypothetical protein
MAPALRFPQDDEIFLDHLGIFVPEFETSASALERLGFLLTPLAIHESALQPGAPLTRLGTANRCAMLREGYIEMLGPLGDTPMALHVRRRLARYPGLHLVAFSACGPERWHRLLTERDLRPDPVARIQRPTPTPDGSQLVRGSIVRPQVDSWPEARVQIVFHETPEIMWPAAYLDHANGAEAVSAMLIVVEDVTETAERFASLTNRKPTAEGGRRRIVLDRGSLLIVDAQEAAALLPGLAVPALPFCAAIAIRSSDTWVSATHFERSAVPYTTSAEGLRVDAVHGLGATFVFHDGASVWDA